MPVFTVAAILQLAHLQLTYLQLALTCLTSGAITMPILT
jgi:hypothetical protein